MLSRKPNSKEENTLSLHPDDLEHMQSFSSYSHAMMTVQEIMEGLDIDGEDSIGEHAEKYNSLNDYERDVAFFYLLGQCYELRSHLAEIFSEDEDD